MAELTVQLQQEHMQRLAKEVKVLSTCEFQMNGYRVNASNHRYG